MNYGSRLKYFKEINGITGKALAEKAGLVPSQIYKIEGNSTKPSLDSLERICAALEITLADFFKEETPEMSPQLRRLLKAARELTPEQLAAVQALLDTIKGAENER